MNCSFSLCGSSASIGRCCQERHISKLYESISLLLLWKYQDWKKEKEEEEEEEEEKEEKEEKEEEKEEEK